MGELRICAPSQQLGVEVVYILYMLLSLLASTLYLLSLDVEVFRYDGYIIEEGVLRVDYWVGYAGVTGVRFFSGEEVRWEGARVDPPGVRVWAFRLSEVPSGDYRVELSHKGVEARFTFHWGAEKGSP